MISCSLAVWSAIAAALLAVNAVLLAFAPRLLLFLAASDTSSLSPLEFFLAQQFAIFLAAIVLALVFNVSHLIFRHIITHSFQIPSTNPPIPPSSVPVEHPLLYPLSIASALSAFCAWNSSDVGSLATVFFVFSLIIALWGSWEVSNRK